MVSNGVRKTLRARLIEWIFAALAAAVIAIVIISFSGFVRSLLTNEPAPVLSITRILPVWVLVPAWITGSFTEEVLFRSYPIERLTQLTGRRWLAGLVTMLAFTLLHLLTWDWIHVLTVVLAREHPADAALLVAAEPGASGHHSRDHQCSITLASAACPLSVVNLTSAGNRLAPAAADSYGWFVGLGTAADAQGSRSTLSHLPRGPSSIIRV